MSIERGLILLALCVVTANSSAEEQSSPLPQPTTNIRMRPEPVQWVPTSVTVISADEINATYRYDLEDLQGYAPGMIVDDLANTPRGAAIGIRGISSGDLSKGFEPAIPILVDGVYIGTHASQMQTLFDAEQIEVARGPRGTLQGAPSPGGAIHIRRTRPTGSLGLNTRASFDRYNGRQFDARLNFPITSSLAGKLTFEWARGGGEFMENSFTDRGGENQRHRTDLSASFLWDYSDNLEFQYTFDSRIDKGDSPALLNISTETDLLCLNSANGETCASPLGPIVPETGSIDRTAQAFSNDREYDVNAHTLRIDFSAAGHFFTSITGVRDSSEILNQDLDGSFADFFSTHRDQEYTQFTQEFRILSRDLDQFHYVAGAWFLETEYDSVQEDPFILNALDEAGLTTPRVEGEIRRVVTGQELSMQSYFAHMNYALDEQWTANLGLRFNHLEKEFDHRPLGLEINNIIPSPVLITDRHDWSETSADAGLSYMVDTEAMIWFRYSWDFRPGGFNESAVSADSAFPYDGEMIHGYEAGLKTEWYNDHLRLNAAVYRTRREEKTERFARTVASGRVESVIDNVASLDIHGLDVEVEWVPTENLYIRGSYSHVSSEYDSYFIPDLTGAEDSIDLGGLLPDRAPPDNVYVFARYSFPCAEGKIGAFFGYRYSSDYQTNSGVTLAKIGNFSTVDLSVEYVWREWSFRLFSQNVKNKRYLQNVQNPSAADVVSLDPATTAPQRLATVAEYNRPRYTGFQVIYQPNFQR